MVLLTYWWLWLLFFIAGALSVGIVAINKTMALQSEIEQLTEKLDRRHRSELKISAVKTQAAADLVAMQVKGETQLAAAQGQAKALAAQLAEANAALKAAQAEVERLGQIAAQFPPAHASDMKALSRLFSELKS